MTTKISAIIAKHITTEARLIIPEVGTLLRRKENGEIVFMEMLRKSDGILAGLIINTLDVSPSNANEIVNNYVATIKQQLATNKKFIIDGVGVLLARADGGINFSFTPSAHSIPEHGVDVLEEDDAFVPVKPIAPAQPVAPAQPTAPAQPVQPVASAAKEQSAPQSVVKAQTVIKPQPVPPTPQPKKVIYKIEEEDESTERRSKIQPHHTRKKMDGITIVALVALAMAFLALIWGMIPSNDRVEVNLDTTTVEVNE